MQNLAQSIGVPMLTLVESVISVSSSTFWSGRHEHCYPLLENESSMHICWVEDLGNAMEILIMALGT